MPEKTTMAARQKRKRTTDANVDDSDDSTKKRGRPRVEQKDGSAADRRRTQIRMAQRAYRQRKETTLDELKQRVSELRTAIESMNDIFADLRDRLLSPAAGLSSAQVTDVAEASNTIAGLMETARSPGNGDRDIGSMATSAGQVPNQKPKTTFPPTAKNVQTWIDHDTLNHIAGSIESPLGYNMYPPEASSFEELAGNFNVQSLAQAMIPSPPTTTTTVSVLQTSGISSPDVFGVVEELPLPTTYSFQETTLGRRIHRACLERAYQMLVHPGRQPYGYEQKFRLVLLGRDRLKVATAMKRILDRGINDDLTCWEISRVHIGGAGTHYARRDQFGEAVKERPVVNIGRVGPQMLSLLEVAAKGDPMTELVVEIAGLEGEWFDPYDVEGYLAEKGVYIDPHASFAEIEAMETTALPSTVSSRTTSTSSSNAPATMQPGNLKQWEGTNPEGLKSFRWDGFAGPQTNSSVSNGWVDADIDAWLRSSLVDDATRLSDLDPAPPQHDFFDLGPDSTLNPLKSPGPHLSPSRISMHKRNVLIDVAKFIEELRATAVCLGRTPGFRRKEVDRALKVASFGAY